MLYGLPVAVNKIADLSQLWEAIAGDGGVIRLLVDHPTQVRLLEDFERKRTNPRRWSVFVKIDGGQHRAGVKPTSADFKDLTSTLLQSPYISIHGFYGHAGNAYASTSLEEATSFLSSEVDSVNIAARIALSMLPGSPFPKAHTQPFVLSVGSTPTAHAAGEKTRAILAEMLNGSLELHAGNYPLLDLQQQHTNLIDHKYISQKVRATVISYYPGRAATGEDEALVDAGAIAFSKDTGPLGGFGRVIGKAWHLARISQEHGILTRLPGQGQHTADGRLEVGEQVEIVGQHACLIAAVRDQYSQ
ncbi:hypothetical protein AX16_009562 [Volvariella volvacea WC 439]|nr:hypothetical protein AX16_009562 [Volvariella volvacea WC 439]